MTSLLTILAAESLSKRPKAVEVFTITDRSDNEITLLASELARYEEEFGSLGGVYDIDAVKFNDILTWAKRENLLPADPLTATLEATITVTCNLNGLSAKDVRHALCAGIDSAIARGLLVETGSQAEVTSCGISVELK
jgi:hypothetical protein